MEGTRDSSVPMRTSKPASSVGAVVVSIDWTPKMRIALQTLDGYQTKKRKVAEILHHRRPTAEAAGGTRAKCTQVITLQVR